MTAVAREDRVVVNSTLLSVIGLANRGLTVVTQVLIASRFGRSVDADAYFAVEILPDLFIVLVGSGLSMAAIPVYGRLRAADGEASGDPARDDAGDFARSFIATATVVFLLLTAALFATAPQLVSWLAPGFDATARETTISLLRVMVLVLAFLGPEAGLRAVFHSHRVFATPDLARFAYNGVLLGFVIFLSGRLGVATIGWGMVVGAAAMMAILVVRGARLGLIRRPSLRPHPAVVEIAGRIPAVLVVLAWPMVLLVLDRAQASAEGVGTLSALGYASRVAMLPIGIVVLPFASVVYPVLSEMVGRRDEAAIGRSLTSGLRTMMFTVLPLSALLIVARADVVQLLFERGEFDRLATVATSEAMLYYSLGLPAMAVVFYLRNAYLALDRSWALCWILLASWVGAWALNELFEPRWEANGIAMATSLAATGTALAMIAHLGLYCAVRFERSAVGPVIVMAALALLVWGVVGGGHALGITALGGDGIVVRLVGFGALASVSLVAYVAAARVASLHEARWLTEHAGELWARVRP